MQAEEIGITVITITLYGIFFLQDREVAMRGIKNSYNMVLDVFFLLTGGIAIVGVMMVLIPENIVIAHLGRQTGLGGILLGTAIGAVLPSGGYIRLPVVSALLTLGAGVGTVVAIVATKSLLYSPQSMAFFGVRVEAVQIPSFILGGVSAGVVAHILATIFI